jgi:hypothetical protein
MARWSDDGPRRRGRRPLYDEQAVRDMRAAGEKNEVIAQAIGAPVQRVEKIVARLNLPRRVMRWETRAE